MLYCQVYRIIAVMGAIIDCNRLHQLFPTQQKIKLILNGAIQQKNRIPQGFIVHLPDNRKGVYVCSDILQKSFFLQHKLITKWISQNFKFSCNVIEYDFASQAYFCNSHVQSKMIIQYGDSSLEQMLTGDSIDNSHISLGNVFKNRYEILKLIKIMLEAVDELRETIGEWGSFHTSTIVHFKKTNNYKYFYLPKLQGMQENVSFFDPQTIINEGSKCEKSTVYSMGVTLLSAFIGEDCSDAFNFNNLTICQSLLQQKYQKAEQVINKQLKFSDSLDSTNSAYAVNQDIIELICEATAKYQDRISLSQFKKKYYSILKKVSSNYSNGLADKSMKKQKCDVEKNKAVSFQVYQLRQVNENCDSLDEPPKQSCKQHRRTINTQDQSTKEDIIRPKKLKVNKNSLQAKQNGKAYKLKSNMKLILDNKQNISNMGNN